MTRFWGLVTGITAIFALSGAADTLASETRTAGRTVEGGFLQKKVDSPKVEFYEFLPWLNDIKNSHPDQWAGQYWDTSAWNEDRWTPEIALRLLYLNHTFHRQYVKNGTPVIEIGPTFYKLSDLDRRRSLRLMANHTDILNKGYKAFLIKDWETRDTIGSYTQTGMYLEK